jgi:hypothetical protein
MKTITKQGIMGKASASVSRSVGINFTSLASR